ncbi:MAG: aldo/keto reductase [Chlamydiota bacterium]|nr:aldo/keto reductase [Chlamydiota bacterium]
MITRRFGRTNLQMPVFSCGGMRFQYKWDDLPLIEIPHESQKNLETVINHAFELGINHFETANGYGTSEIQLGQILPEFPREKIIVQTKVSPTKDPEEFLRNVDISLKRLNLDYVDLLSLHGINNEELLRYSLQPKGCLDAAQKLQKSGRVRFIGFSTHAHQLNIIQEAIATDLFDYVNIHWYFIFQKNWPAVLEANKRDMGVFIISPSDKGGMLYQPPQKLTDLCKPLSPIQFNNLFCLNHHQVHTLSIGAAKASDFEEHLKTLPLLEDPSQHLTPIVERLRDASELALGKNWLETWQIGLPDLLDTPNEINIPTILWLRNLALAFDMISYGKMRYNLLGSGGHWFPGNKANRIDNKDIYNCCRNSPHAGKIAQLLIETHNLLDDEPVQRLSLSK